MSLVSHVEDVLGANIRYSNGVNGPVCLTVVRISIILLKKHTTNAMWIRSLETFFFSL